MGGVPFPLTGLEKGGVWGSLSLGFLPIYSVWQCPKLVLSFGTWGKILSFGVLVLGMSQNLELHPFGDQAIPALGGEFWGALGVSNLSITLTKLLAPPSFLVFFFVPTAHTGGISFITIFGEERLCRGH